MNSIRRLLTSRLLLAFTLILGIAGVAIYLLARLGLYRELDAQLKFKALAMAALTKPVRDYVDLEFPERIASVAGGEGVPEYFQLFDAQTNILAQSPGLSNFVFQPQFGVLENPAFWNLRLPDGSHGRAVGVEFVAKPPAPKPKPRPKDKEKEAKPPPPEPVPVRLVIACSSEKVNEQLQRLLWILAIAGSGSVAATLILVPRLLRRGLEPLQKLGEQAGGISAASLQVRFPTERLPEELRPIVSRLNELLARLESSFERERRFSADLAHELRTPIASLRATADVALQWPEQGGRESWEAVHELAVQMEAMSEQLLAMTRAEQSDWTIQRQPVCLKPLFNSVWQQLRVTAEGRRISLALDMPEDASLDTDVKLLRAIISNLLGNSVEYAPAGSRIEVGFHAVDGGFELRIANPSNNLKPEDVPKLFDRFWRKDQARTASGHLGLGLSICKSFANLLGYELGATLSGSNILVMSLRGRFSNAA